MLVTAFVTLFHDLKKIPEYQDNLCLRVFNGLGKNHEYTRENQMKTLKYLRYVFPSPM